MKSTSNTKQSLSSFPVSLQDLISRMEREDISSPRDVMRLLNETNVSEEDLKTWARFNHDLADSYGREMVFKGKNFEVMVMSWCPGDFSAIHDHGQTQWGAVKIFGPAEHATFSVINDEISTLSRSVVTPGTVVGVGHSLIHQMGNPTENTFFLSMHVYGLEASVDNVTGDARIFDPVKGEILFVDGGVFYNLPDDAIKRRVSGPKGDFPTRLRDSVEAIRRSLKMGHEAKDQIAEVFSDRHKAALMTLLKEHLSSTDHFTHSRLWDILNQELRAVARLQDQLDLIPKGDDHFHKYAELYDALICQPCLDDFMAKYIHYFIENFSIDLERSTVFSLGCGTGLVEEYLIDALGAKKNNVYGIDISPSMVQVARKRIQADVGDVLALDPGIQLWDIAYSGLNVFQYLPSSRLEEAIQKTAAIVKDGGYFIGDFITPDHIRWYPNVMRGPNADIISLRTPRLIEIDGRTYQESEIINLNFTDHQMEVNYSGKHKRFLPPIHRVRSYFKNAFKGEVILLDAHSLEVIPEWADSCPSTRYVVIAQKRP